jgi:lipopolysaccharide biosynthesis glycosyltransferase
MIKSIYIGFDPREVAAYLVTVGSIERRLTSPIPIFALYLPELVRRGVYNRPTKRVGNQLHDVISQHPMSTEFAVSRFLVPHLAKRGWAAFVDCDVMSLCDFNELFALADPKYAVMCVKHHHVPTNTTKMDGQVQSAYPRKNWSSVILWNCDHPANKQQLTVDYVNRTKGKALHAFEWLCDNDIGELPLEFNYLVGINNHSQCKAPPKIIHFTEGIPHVLGHADDPYSDLWRAELQQTLPSTLRALDTLPA